MDCQHPLLDAAPQHPADVDLPSFLIQVSGRNERRRSHLLSIEPKSHVTRAVLSLGNGPYSPISVVRKYPTPFFRLKAIYPERPRSRRCY